MGDRKRALASWMAFSAHYGFGLLNIDGSAPERFVIAPVAASMAPELRRRGLRVGEFLTEAEVRRQLGQSGLSDAEVEAALRLARIWTHRTGYDREAEPSGR